MGRAKTNAWRSLPMRLAALLVWTCSSIAFGAPATPAVLKAEALILPGGPQAILMDYLAVDLPSGRLWVPAGNTGKVDVVESGSRENPPGGGFPVAQRGPRTGRPPSATVGGGVV